MRKSRYDMRMCFKKNRNTYILHISTPSYSIWLSLSLSHLSITRPLILLCASSACNVAARSFVWNTLPKQQRSNKPNNWGTIPYAFLMNLVQAGLWWHPIDSQQHTTTTRPKQFGSRKAVKCRILRNRSHCLSRIGIASADNVYWNTWNAMGAGRGNEVL